jgi:hypothetical protein
MDDILLNFKKYCTERRWMIDKFSSEFTIQFRLSWYIQSIDSNCQIELESNVNRYSIGNLVKKEIDIDYYNISQNEKIAIELKYIRDKGSYNIGIFRYYEDIKFLEQLIESEKFDKGYCILFTSVPEMYTEPFKSLNPRNEENLDLYQSFRCSKILQGTVSIKTGKLNKAISISGSYPLEWIHFSNDIRACIVEIKQTDLLKK